MTNIAKKSWTRRLASAAVLAALLTSGGLVSSEIASSASAADGPRCCH
jgi:hypothetical protein